jgi:hypothetical protein
MIRSSIGSKHLHTHTMIIHDPIIDRQQALAHAYHDHDDDATGSFIESSPIHYRFNIVKKGQH